MCIDKMELIQIYRNDEELITVKIVESSLMWIIELELCITLV